MSIKTARIKSGAANPVPKLLGVIGGMCAGADSIEDLDVLRAGEGVNEVPYKRRPGEDLHCVAAGLALGYGVLLAMRWRVHRGGTEAPTVHCSGPTGTTMSFVHWSA